MANARICSVPDCGKPHRGLGYCNAHMLRFRRHGDPLGGAKFRDGAPMAFLEALVGTDRTDCVFWPFARISNGYPTVLNKYAHRVVCEMVHGAPPTPRHECAHACGNGHLACVNPNHLSWKTGRENQADRLHHGTHQFGENNRRAKLSEQDVRDIRAQKGIVTQVVLAAKYGVSKEMVSLIQRGKSWTQTA